MSFNDSLNQYKKKDSSALPPSSDTVQNLQDKDKVFSYSTNSGLVDKPCEKPFESNCGVELNFNFWTDNRCLIDQHVIDIIVNLLRRRSPPVLRAKSNFIDSLEHVVVVSAHGVDPKELGVEVKSLKFLSQCSSMPVNHVQVLDIGLSSAPVRWQYLDAEDMNSLILWPERPSLEGEELLKIPIFSIFSDFNSVFMAEHTDWQDEIFFTMDAMVTKDTVTSLIKSKSDLCESYLKNWYAELETSLSDVACLGRFKRLRSGDSGLFVLSKDVSVVHLLWNKWDMEILDVIASRKDRIDDDNGDGDASVQLLSLVKRLPSQQQTERVLTDLYLELKKATFRPAVGNASTCPSSSSSVKNSSGSVATSKTSTDGEKTPASSTEAMLAELKETYRDLTTNPSAYPCTLDDLVLSPNMMSMMGYTLHTFQESGFLDTKSNFWKSSSAEGKSGSHIRFDEVEEGEEVEETLAVQPQETAASDSGTTSETKYERLSVCAIDCEMCATDAGLELTRITVICPERGVVYDTLVQPKRPIVEYHTAFSGITKDALEGVTTMIEDVHNVLRQLIDRDTIIVGHSLDSDLKTLHLVHTKVIDTAALFPSIKGLPFKASLKSLAKEYLGKDIQEGEGTATGHDSVQDSAIALQLAFLKASRGDSIGGFYPWKDNAISRYNLFEHLTNNLGSPLQCVVHSCLSHTAKSEWERHAFGYGSESSSAVAASLFTQTSGNSCSVSVQQLSHSSVDEVVEHSCKTLQGLKSSRQAQSGGASSFTWIDLPVTSELIPPQKGSRSGGEVQPAAKRRRMEGTSDEENMDGEDDAMDQEENDDEYGQYDDENSDNDNGESGGGRKRHVSQMISATKVMDKYVERLYAAAPANSVMIVMTQGDLSPLKLLAAQKMRNRWEASSFKKKLHLADCSRTAWDTAVDDKKLTTAAAHAIAGAVFLRNK